MATHRRRIRRRNVAVAGKKPAAGNEPAADSRSPAPGICCRRRSSSSPAAHAPPVESIVDRSTRVRWLRSNRYADEECDRFLLLPELRRVRCATSDQNPPPARANVTSDTDYFRQITFGLNKKPNRPQRALVRE